jgi:predicted RecA/RadA family phage recombinase
MAKNYVQDGKTIPLVNSDTTDILSGEPVVVGSLIAVAITDIAAGQTGDGLAEGVFMLPKLPADDISAGAAVFIKDGQIQLAEEDALAAGIAWEAAGAGMAVVDVKING